MKSTERMLSLMGSSASTPAMTPKFLKSCHTQFRRTSPMAVATKIWYMVLAAGKYRRKVPMSHPRAPSTETEIRSSPFITCSAIHSTMPSRIPMVHPSFRLSVPLAVCKERADIGEDEAKPV